MASEEYSVEVKAELDEFNKNLEEARLKLLTVQKTADDVSAKVKSDFKDTKIKIEAEDHTSSILAKIGHAVLTTTKVIAGLALGIKGAQLLLKGLIDELESGGASGPFSRFAKSAANATTNLLSLVTKIPGVTNFLKGFGIDPQKIISSGISFQFLVDSLKGLLQTSPAFTNFAKNFVNTVDKIQGSILKLGRPLIDGFKSTFSRVRELFAEFSDIASDPEKGFGLAVENILRQLAFDLDQNAPKAGAAINRFFKDAFSQVSNSTAVQAVSNTFKDVFNKVVTFTKPATDAISSFVASASKTLHDKFPGVFSTIEKISEPISKAVSSITKKFSDGFDRELPKIGTALRNGFSKVATFASPATNAVGGFFDKLSSKFPTLTATTGHLLNMTKAFGALLTGAIGLAPGMDHLGNGIGLIDDSVIIGNKGLSAFGANISGASELASGFVFSLNAVNAAITVAGTVFEALGKKIISTTIEWGLASSRTDLALRGMVNALESANNSTGKNLGTTAEWTQFIKDLAAETGQAEAEIGQLAFRFLQLEPTTQLTQDQLKQLISRTAVLGTAFGDLTDISFKVISGFSGFVGPMNRFLGLGARTNELNRLMAQGFTLTSDAQQGQIDAQKHAAFSSDLFNIFMKGTNATLKTVQGSSENLVIALHHLSAAQENAKAAFGTAATSALVPFIDLLTKFYNALRNIPEPIRKTIAELIVFAGNLITGVGIVLKYAGTFVLLTQSINIFNEALKIPIGTMNTVGSLMSGFISRATGTKVAITSASTAFVALGKVGAASLKSLDNAIGSVLSKAAFTGTGAAFGTLLPGLDTVLGKVKNKIETTFTSASKSVRTTVGSIAAGLALNQNVSSTTLTGALGTALAKPAATAAGQLSFSFIQPAINGIIQSTQKATIASRLWGTAVALVNGTYLTLVNTLKLVDEVIVPGKLAVFLGLIAAFINGMGHLSVDLGLTSNEFTAFSIVADGFSFVIAKVTQLIETLSFAMATAGSLILNGFAGALRIAVEILIIVAQKIDSVLGTNFGSKLEKLFKPFLEVSDIINDQLTAATLKNADATATAASRLASWSKEVGNAAAKVKPLSEVMAGLAANTKKQIDEFNKLLKSIDDASGADQRFALRAGNAAAAQKKFVDNFNEGQRLGKEAGTALPEKALKPIPFKFPGIEEPILTDPARLLGLRSGLTGDKPVVISIDGKVKTLSIEPKAQAQLVKDIDAATKNIAEFNKPITIQFDTTGISAESVLKGSGKILSGQLGLGLDEIKLRDFVHIKDSIDDTVKSTNELIKATQSEGQAAKIGNDQLEALAKSVVDLDQEQAKLLLELDHAFRTFLENQKTPVPKTLQDSLRNDLTAAFNKVRDVNIRLQQEIAVTAKAKVFGTLIKDIQGIKDAFALASAQAVQDNSILAEPLNNVAKTAKAAQDQLEKLIEKRAQLASDTDLGKIDFRDFLKGLKDINNEITTAKDNLREVTAGQAIESIKNFGFAFEQVTKNAQETRNILGNTFDPLRVQIDFIDNAIKSQLAEKDKLDLILAKTPDDVKTKASIEAINDSLVKLRGSIDSLSITSAIDKVNTDLEKAEAIAIRSRSVFGSAFDITDTQIQNVTTALTNLIEAEANALKRLQEIQEQGSIVPDDEVNKIKLLTDGIAKLKIRLEELKDLQDVKNIVNDVFDAISQGIADTVKGVVQGTQTMKEALKSLAQNILLTLSADIFKSRVVEPIKKSIDKFLDTLDFFKPKPTQGVSNTGTSTTTTSTTADKAETAANNNVTSSNIFSIAVTGFKNAIDDLKVFLLDLVTKAQAVIVPTNNGTGNLSNTTSDTRTGINPFTGQPFGNAAELAGETQGPIKAQPVGSFTDLITPFKLGFRATLDAFDQDMTDLFKGKLPGHLIDAISQGLSAAAPLSSIGGPAALKVPTFQQKIFPSLAVEKAVTLEGTDPVFKELMHKILDRKIFASLNSEEISSIFRKIQEMRHEFADIAIDHATRTVPTGEFTSSAKTIIDSGALGQGTKELVDFANKIVDAKTTFGSLDKFFELPITQAGKAASSFAGSLTSAVKGPIDVLKDFAQAVNDVTLKIAESLPNLGIAEAGAATLPGTNVEKFPFLAAPAPVTNIQNFPNVAAPTNELFKAISTVTLGAIDLNSSFTILKDNLVGINNKNLNAGTEPPSNNTPVAALTNDITSLVTTLRGIVNTFNQAITSAFVPVIQSVFKPAVDIFKQAVDLFAFAVTKPQQGSNLTNGLVRTSFTGGNPSSLTSPNNDTGTFIGLPPGGEIVPGQGDILPGDVFRIPAQEVATKAAGAANDTFNQLGATLVGDIVSLATKGKPTISGVFNQLSGFLNQSLNKLFTELLNSAQSGGGSGGGSGGFGGLFSGLGDSISSGFSTAWSWITGLFGAATGGLLPGSPSKEDSVLLKAAPGEFITQSDAVSFYGAGIFNALNNKKIPKEALGRFVAGTSGSASFGNVPEVSKKLKDVASIFARIPGFAEGGLVGNPISTIGSLTPRVSSVAANHPVVDDRPITVTINDRSPKLDPKSFGLKEADVIEIFVSGVKKDKVIRRVIRQDIKGNT